MWGDGGDFGAWAQTLERWQGGEVVDLSTLPLLARDHFASSTWTRLTDRVVGAINERLRSWSVTINREWGTATSEFGAGRALTHAREGLRAVLAVAGHPSLPADLREQLIGLVAGQIRSVQEALERGLDGQAAQGVPRDHLEARRRTLRANPLTAVLVVDPVAVVPSSPVPQPAPPATAPGGRSHRTLYLG